MQQQQIELKAALTQAIPTDTACESHFAAADKLHNPIVTSIQIALSNKTAPPTTTDMICWWWGWRMISGHGHNYRMRYPVPLLSITATYFNPAWHSYFRNSRALRFGTKLQLYCYCFAINPHNKYTYSPFWMGQCPSIRHVIVICIVNVVVILLPLINLSINHKLMFHSIIVPIVDFIANFIYF